MLAPDENLRLTNLYSSLREKLLDLTKRNRMLSYTLGARSRRSLQIVDAVPNAVYHSLVDQGASLELRALDEPKGQPTDEKSEDFIEALDHARNTDIAYLTQIRALESTGRDDEFAIAAADLELRIRVRESLGMPPRPTLKEINRNDHARSLGINPNTELPLSTNSQGKRLSGLQTLKFPDELESALELVAADARLAEQEMGLSTLFLSFGFIEWYSSNSSDLKAFAPLLLLPVNLERRKLSGKWHYSISSGAEAVETNLSLQKFLESEFGRQLPEMEALDEEDTASIDEYFSRVGEAIRGLDRWKVHRWMVLGHFSFGRLAMYADLSLENWKDLPIEHRLLKVILQGTETIDNADLPTAPHDYDVDDPEVEKLTPVLIQDADASQHSALVDVMRGTNLVIQGPPGTGKSQTITNIIANALASNKTVLFLAEKRAALDVVKRRLDRCDLGAFCLELHSDKSSPKQIIQNLKERSELESSTIRNTRPKQDGNALWRDARTSLREYLDALHTKDTLGDDTFGLIWRAIRGRSQIFDRIMSSRPNSSSDRLFEHEQAVGALKIFCEAAKRFEENYGRLNESVWYPIISSSTASVGDAGLITATVSTLSNSINNIQTELANLAEFELATLDDLRSIKVVNGLPDKISDPELVAVVERYDLNALERRLRRQRDILNLDLELKIYAPMRNTSLRVFDKAASIVNTCEPLPVLKYSAKDCLTHAQKWIELLPAVLEALHSFAPAFQVLKVPEDFMASGIESVALCVILASDLKEQQRQWLANGITVDEVGFTKFDAERLQITKRDTEWRRQFISYRYSPWPSPEELMDATKLLKKGFLGKTLAAVGSKARKAGQIVKTLGYETDDSAAAQTIEKLANHVQQFDDFWQNREFAELFGTHWRGPETAFDEIRFGVRYREFLRQHLSPLSQGEIVVQRFVSLGPSDILSLSRYAKAGHFFRDLAIDVRSIFGIQPIAEFETEVNSRLNFAKLVVGIDPSNELAEFEQSIDEINKIGLLEAKRRALVDDHQFDVLVPSTEVLESNIETIDASLEAINWVRHIAFLAKNSQTRMQLLSSDCVVIRKRIEQFNNMIEADLDRLEAGLTKLQETFSIAMHHRSIVELHKELTALFNRHAEAYDAIALKQWQTVLVDAGLEDFVASAFEADISPADMPRLFEAHTARQRVDQARRESPALTKYTGGIIEAYRTAFAERDRVRQKDDSAALKSSLISRLPVSGTNVGPKRDWTEMWMLKNEFQKQARFASVRSLVRRAPRSLQALKPCFMMSPLSLAKFVAPDSIEFDLLVIDEASQMRPEDAFGAFLRCKQVVVVGDTKQLPPTQFFNRTDEDGSSWEDEESDAEEAAESVLESCHKSFGQIRQLKWHYRSRCESLIAFSNGEFYNNSLVTFPTARPASFSVSLLRVDGTYQARRNIAEASKIAEEAVSFMRAFAQRPESEVLSLGIVALNVQQRELIQAELHRLEAGDELVERYKEFVARRGEEVFVKNLENVQGDERDFIFISLTYGKEAGATAMKQRFGPINSKSGHRRLNVLFTRARVRIAVFSSFGSNDVVASPQSNEGVHVLKRYLQYAEQRGRGLVESIGTETDSDFESEVADRLRREGFEVDYQVGVSGFRIDLGIKHPDYPSVYLAGIECDGARFHSSKSARDRDRLREEVLTGLGWKIVRVWSTDWYANADEETKKLVSRLRAIQLLPALQDKEYDLRSTYEVKSEAPSFEDIEATTTEDEVNDGSLDVDRSSDVGPLSEEEAVSVLEVFRDSVIAKEIENWERQRSILRDSMIEALIKQRVIDPREWIIKVPHYQRSGTNQIEKNRYLSAICRIVSRIAANSPLELGETEETEFKSTLRVNMATRQRDSKMEFSALRAMASLLNSNGGKLVIGVSDDGKALGLEIDGFESEDRMSIHLNNLIHERIGSHHSAHIRVRFEDYDDARIMAITCSRARLPVFLKDGGAEKFFIRNGTSTRELSGVQQFEYIKSRFGS
jgi:very-short-patch-repair endonuclease